MNTQSNNKPIHVVRCGSIKAACWLNSSEKGVYFSTAITSSYLDESTGEWSDTTSFSGHRDLLAVAHVAQEMCRWICQYRHIGDKQATNEA